MITAPSKPLFWIIGEGGLLGSRVSNAIRSLAPATACWKGLDEKLCWGNPHALTEQLHRAAGEFAAAVRQRGGGWGVIWTAGAGVVGTTEDLLAAETSSWEAVLSVVDRYLVAAQLGPGLVFLTSSAGGVYGNCPDQLITEESQCSPISAYGRNKLRQESVFNAWADAHPEIVCRIGRISNIYGPGQNLAKAQGLVSHISRSLIWQIPIHLYVPLDTIRDYIYVDDCAHHVAYSAAAWLRDARQGMQSMNQRVKIFAAEEPTTVAQIVSEFTRLSIRRHPRVICAPSALGLQQPRRLQFRSNTGPDLRDLRRTTLHVGVSRVHAHQLGLYHSGRLRAPSSHS